MITRVATVAVFAIVMSAVFLGGTYYLASRLVLEPAWGRPWTAYLLGLFMLLALLPLLQALAERLAPPRLSRIVAWPANLFLGFAFYLLIGLVATDLALVFVGAAFDEGGTTLPRSRALVVGAFALTAGGAALVSGLAAPRLARHHIELTRWPQELDGLRIVQISDIHIGSMIHAPFARSIVERVNALEPDLIAVTGDLVDGPVHHLEAEVAPFADLHARHGVYFVLGNHDYYSGADAWLEHVRKLGMYPLRNEHVRIERDEASFLLAGVDDHRGHLFGPGHGEDVPAAVEGRIPDEALILLAHDPSTFRAAQRHGVDLQLSGHTHGGQIWPFDLLVRAAVGFVSGHYRRGESQLVVSHGTGYWGPPMRLRAPAEIVEITLHPPAPAPGERPPASA